MTSARAELFYLSSLGWIRASELSFAPKTEQHLDSAHASHAPQPPFEEVRQQKTRYRGILTPHKAFG